MNRYECTLRPEALKKAIAELNEPENNDIRLAEIDKLRTRFEEESEGLELIRTDDAFLLRFLRVRKFDQDRALALLKNYHQLRKDWRDVFDLVDNPKLLDDLLHYGPVLPLNERAKDGTFVIIGRPGRGFKENDSITKFFALITLSMENLLENEEMQIYGITVIEDMAEFGLSLASQMATSGRKFIHLMQDGIPVRVKSVNMVNEARVFDIVYSIVSVFMKEKLRNRLALHGTCYSNLHKNIDVKHLPMFLGGSGPDLNADAWRRKLLCTLGEGEDTAL